MSEGLEFVPLKIQAGDAFYAPDAIREKRGKVVVAKKGRPSFRILSTHGMNEKQMVEYRVNGGTQSHMMPGAILEGVLLKKGLKYRKRENITGANVSQSTKDADFSSEENAERGPKKGVRRNSSEALSFEGEYDREMKLLDRACEIYGRKFLKSLESIDPESIEFPLAEDATEEDRAVVEASVFDLKAQLAQYIQRCREIIDGYERAKRAGKRTSILDEQERQVHELRTLSNGISAELVSVDWMQSVYGYETDILNHALKNISEEPMSVSGEIDARYESNENAFFETEDPVQKRDLLQALRGNLSEIAFAVGIDEYNAFGVNTDAVRQAELNQELKNEKDIRQSGRRKKTADVQKSKGGRGEKGRKHIIDKRAAVKDGDSLVAIPPIIDEKGVQLEEDVEEASIIESTPSQFMKNPGESIPGESKSEKSQEVLVAFKEAAEKEKQVFLTAIQNTDSFKTLRSIGFVVGKQRYFLEATGDNITPALAPFVEKIKNESQREDQVFLNDINKELDIAWVEKKKTFKKEKPLKQGKEKESPEVVFAALVKALKNRKYPFKKDGRELSIDSVSSEEIKFRYRGEDTEGAWVARKIKSAQAERFRKDLWDRFDFELFSRGNKKKSVPIKKEVLEQGTSTTPLVESVATTLENLTPENLTESLDRTYETLRSELGRTSREISLEVKRLESAVAAGLQKIAEAIPDEAALITFVRDNKENLVKAFSPSVSVRLERFSWTSDGKEFFAETFVKQEIEKFLEI